LTLESKIVRNRLVNEHLNVMLKPLLFTAKNSQNRITTGNTTDDMAKIADVD
jgi:3-hydroxyacyl-CoA dehydrogenase